MQLTVEVVFHAATVITWLVAVPPTPKPEEPESGLVRATRRLWRSFGLPQKQPTAVPPDDNPLHR